MIKLCMQCISTNTDNCYRCVADSDQNCTKIHFFEVHEQMLPPFLFFRFYTTWGPSFK